MEFLVDNIYGSSINNTYKIKFLVEGLECYKDTQMKACDITKIAELKSDNIQYRNTIYYFVACYRQLWPSCAIYSTATPLLLLGIGTSLRFLNENINIMLGLLVNQSQGHSKLAYIDK